MPPLVEIWHLVVLAAALVAAAVVDLRSGKIYNTITYPAALIGLVGHTVAAGLVGDGQEAGIGLVGSALGLVVGFAPLFLAWRLGAIGGGDAKLMGAVGALGGMEFVVSAMFYSCVVAVVMALIVMIRHRIVGRTLGRIFRFVYLAAVRRNPGDPASPDSPTVAFGLALCIGSAGAAVQLALQGRLFFEL
jgi:prepilin peptidase CpaA